MSHNSYQLKVFEINSEYDRRSNELCDGAAKALLSAKNERHFTQYDIEEAGKCKWYIAVASFSVGIILTTIIIHYLN